MVDGREVMEKDIFSRVVFRWQLSLWSDEPELLSRAGKVSLSLFQIIS
jgi:hypothetical protein